MRSIFSYVLLSAVVMAVMVNAMNNAQPSQVLDRRQNDDEVGADTTAAGAALGGGAGAPATHVSMESISGYTAPPSSAIPTPSNFKTGTILSPSQISGYAEAMRATSGADYLTVPRLLVALTAASIAGLVLL
ncbi:hypothetical protein MYAM1_002556 [Malassezia yamatoensis]|uniref:Uncharacterized protein n=1 Tax=Malassezia yamatoensis TaxID=253288 RepID=A0AAJ5YTA8_9BASI|nr:hypothetical protein MYAM1_002556 [Malassezia yamatoensis]